MKDRIAISAYCAAHRLFSEGHSLEEVQSILDSLNQPSVGYFYADELPASATTEQTP